MLDSSLPRSLECHQICTSEPFVDFSTVTKKVKIYLFDWDMKTIHLFKVEP